MGHKSGKSYVEAGLENSYKIETGVLKHTYTHIHREMEKEHGQYFLNLQTEQKAKKSNYVVASIIYNPILLKVKGLKNN